MSQTLQICNSVLNRSKNENEIKTESKPKNNFLALGDLVRSSNKVFIESQRLFFCQQKEDMMEWPSDRLCNMIEIKNNEMIQPFLVEKR